MLARQTRRTLIALCAAAVIGPASAMACHEDLARLKHEFSVREAQLKYAYKAERRALHQAHRALLDELDCAHRQAHRLCGPERAAAHDQIHHRRRVAHKTYACKIRELNASRRAALDALDAEYHLARKSLKCACNRTPPIVHKPHHAHPPLHDRHAIPIPPSVREPYGATESPFFGPPRNPTPRYGRPLRFSGRPAAGDRCGPTGCRPAPAANPWSDLLLSLATGYLERQ